MDPCKCLASKLFLFLMISPTFSRACPSILSLRVDDDDLDVDDYDEARLDEILPDDGDNKALVGIAPRKPEVFAVTLCVDANMPEGVKELLVAAYGFQL